MAAERPDATIGVIAGGDEERRHQGHDQGRRIMHRTASDRLGMKAPIVNHDKRISTSLSYVGTLFVMLCFAVSAHAAENATTGTIQTRIGPMDLFMGMPATSEVEQKIYDEMDFQRATQAYIWALPIVAFNEWKRAQESFGAKPGDIVVYNNYKDKLGILTANFTTPYLVSFADLKDGPVVVEQPKGNFGGAIIDFWQRPIVDMGQAGPDRGDGAKYLIVGPGQSLPKTTAGYLVYRSRTNNIFLANRVLDPGPDKLDYAVKSWSIYPYSQKDHPPAHRSLTPEGKAWGQWQPRGMEYWKSLDEILQQEPVEERDRMMTAMLAPLGIEKGKPFQPDARQTELLTQGAQIGELMAMNISYDKRFANSYYRPDSKWAYVIMLDPSQEAPNFTQLDERADYFYEAVTMTQGMVSSTPGIGSAYLGAYKDKDNSWLDGGKNYTLHVPPNPPAKNFWSVTLYDVYDRVGIDNKTQLADISSRQQDLQKNADGSVDLYFGPEPPPGKESNWLQTNADQAWFAYFRFYGPLQPYFDRSWKLPDIERAN